MKYARDKVFIILLAIDLKLIFSFINLLACTLIAIHLFQMNFHYTLIYPWKKLLPCKNCCHFCQMSFLFGATLYINHITIIYYLICNVNLFFSFLLMHYTFNIWWHRHFKYIVDVVYVEFSIFKFFK